MEYTEKHFGSCLRDKLSKNEPIEKIADFAREFKENYTNNNEFMITILETLSRINEEDNNVVIPREKLEKLAWLLQGGVGALPSRKLALPRFQIDTNRINARGGEEFMNQLEQWAEEGIIDIDCSETVLGELQGKYKQGKNMNLRFEKAAKGIFTGGFEEDETDPMFLKIESILCPNGCKDDNQKNDVRIVFHAWKYKYTLITNDGKSRAQPDGILGHAERLREIGVEVIRDSEAVTMVRKKIIERDEYAKRYSEETGMPLPFRLFYD